MTKAWAWYPSTSTEIRFCKVYQLTFLMTCLTNTPMILTKFGDHSLRLSVVRVRTPLHLLSQELFSIRRRRLGEQKPTRKLKCPFFSVEDYVTLQLIRRAIGL
ncbi:hypothetical protein RRG08_029581 [Elysia crispata]|uniref:Uncharacterized protein n=1 Tax=Elysia crispata TaxID=231223 RepID=A0AAE1CJP6_9GAST|nr:hypothetical protein RRG08_029581 [Elysia crispata]